MISIYDESDGPPNPATVMRMEVMHPESGEMNIFRIGPKRISLVMQDNKTTPNRFEIAEYIMNELKMKEYIDTNTKELLPPRMLTLKMRDV